MLAMSNLWRASAPGVASTAFIQAFLLTDTQDGDGGAIEDGDLGGERPNDQRVLGGVGNDLR
jgi:hypothetical protein